MKLRDTVLDFVGKSLESVHWAKSLDAEDSGDYSMVGVAFGFECGFVIFWVNPELDTVDFGSFKSLEEWRGGGGWGSGGWDEEDVDWDIGPVSLEAQLGKPLVEAWDCRTRADHRDAVDLSFGDLLFPTFKLFALSSNLHVLRIQVVTGG